MEKYKNAEDKLFQIEQIVDTVMNNLINADYCWSCKKKFFCKKYPGKIIPLFNLCREHEELGAAMIDIHEILEEDE